MFAAVINSQTSSGAREIIDGNKWIVKKLCHGGKFKDGKRGVTGHPLEGLRLRNKKRCSQG